MKLKDTPWKKSSDKPRQCIKKQRHCQKVPCSQNYGLSSNHAWMWELDHKESWALKNLKNAFKLWCWKRVLRVPWIARRSNQLILKETNPDYSLEGLLLKLKLQHSGHLMGRADSLEKTLMLEKIEGRLRWVGWGAGEQRIGWLESITESVDMNLSKLWEMEYWSAYCALVRGAAEWDTI